MVRERAARPVSEDRAFEAEGPDVEAVEFDVERIACIRSR
jgi:hypothetical protein